MRNGLHEEHLIKSCNDSLNFLHKIAGFCYGLPKSLSTFCLEMAVSKGEKIFAAVLAAIIVILFVVVIVLLATQWDHDDETGM